MEKSSSQRYNEDDEEMLKLSLSIGSRSHVSSQSSPLLAQPQPPPPPPPQSPHVYVSPPANSFHQEAVGPSSSSRTRKSPAQTVRPGKSEIIMAQYPWATTRRATIYTLEYLLSKGLNIISGEVQCKRCDKQYEIEYDLQQKFQEISSFVSKNKFSMRDRAPPCWMNPTLPNCKFCDQSNCVKPVSSKKRSINWLFLLLGQMLGCCKLSELKYFCKHTKNHRTGAKDRVLYLTYLGLCKQLDPRGPFEV